MDLREAMKLGRVCGLRTIPECVNNVFLHATSLFRYEDINRELDELKRCAENVGVEFCPICGAAMLNGKCYMAPLTHREEDQ